MKTGIFGWAAVSVLVAMTATAARAAEDAAPDGTIHPLVFHTASPLQLEPVGLTSVRAWYRELTPGRANDQSPWKQLVWFKRDSRTFARSYFAVVDFEKGTLKELPAVVPAMEPWESAWFNGKYYLGTNLPAHLTVFDPATDTLTDLGLCFSGGSATCYRVTPTTDGMILLSGGTGSDVSLYDPRTGQFTHFGQVASKPGGGSYAYYVSADDKYIYAAARSSEPWELVRLDRKTKERKVLLTCPAQAHMSVGPGGAEIANNGPKKWYNLVNGEVVEVKPEARQKAWSVPGPGFTGTPPRIAIDRSPILTGEEALTVHIQTPDGREWRQTKLPLKLDMSSITHLAAMDDDRLVGLPGAYFAMVIVDPKTGKTERIPMGVSTYGMLPVGDRIFIAGYPSARTLVFDTTKPMTWEEDLPNRPGVKETDPNANPKLLRFLGQDTGGAHIGMLLTKGVDGNIYMIARRHRYFFGFSLVNFNPEPGPNGEFVSTVFDDKGAFDHLQISTMQPVDGGKQMIISTQVQHNKQLPGQAPESAAVFLFDVAAKKIVGRYEPLPGAKQIAVATMAGPDVMIGSAQEYRKGAPSTTFRYNIRTNKLEQVRHVNWGLGDNFSLQADGKLWGSVHYGNYGVVFTLDPKDLSTKGIGQTEAASPGLCFHQGELYLSGYPTIMRVKGLTLPQASVVGK
jgi:hypothetical protein